MVDVCILGLITTAVLVPPHWWFLGFNRWTMMWCCTRGHTGPKRGLPSSTTQPAFVPTGRDTYNYNFFSRGLFLDLVISLSSLPGSWPLLLYPKPIRGIIHSSAVRQQEPCQPRDTAVGWWVAVTSQIPPQNCTPMSWNWLSWNPMSSNLELIIQETYFDSRWLSKEEPWQFFSIGKKQHLKM